MYVSRHCSVYHHFIVGNWKMDKTPPCYVMWSVRKADVGSIIRRFLPPTSSDCICRQTPDYATTAFQRMEKLMKPLCSFPCMNFFSPISLITYCIPQGAVSAADTWLLLRQILFSTGIHPVGDFTHFLFYIQFPLEPIKAAGSDSVDMISWFYFCLYFD